MLKLVAGNWKMNGSKADGTALAKELVARTMREAVACDLLICPPATLLHPVHEIVKGSAVALGGQNCHHAQKGPHTGEISATMLKDAGCTHVILGHSERRAEQGEDDALIRAKVAAARAAGLVAVVCVGETQQEREGGHALDVVGRQLQGSLPDGLAAAEIVIAYEPVWAIGAGRTPNQEQIAEVHAYIRQSLSSRVRDAASVRILYGGSVKPSNAAELLHIANVDGALIGGASLVAADFWAIAQAAG